jgi:hypothetical protein
MVEIISLGLGVVGVVLTLFAWMFPDFRHWILPRIGLRLDLFAPARSPSSTHTQATRPVDQKTGYGAGEAPPENRILAKMQCPTCKSTGNSWGRYTNSCEKCHGRGGIYSFRVGQPACRRCRGTGLQNGRYTAFCDVCDGVGLKPYDVHDRDHEIVQAGA